MRTLATLVLAGAMLASAGPANPSLDQYGVVVYEGDCLVSVEKDANTYLEIPLDSNGHPDKDRATINGIKVTYTLSCGRIEIRHRNPETKLAQK